MIPLVKFIGGAKATISWLKENWKIPFVIVWTFVVYLVSRKNTSAAIDVLEAKDKSHKAQIKNLKEKHAQEIVERDNLIEQYKNTVSKIEKDFKEKERVLTDQEKQRVKEIVAESKGDTNEVKKQIEKMFNFTFTD